MQYDKKICKKQFLLLLLFFIYKTAMGFSNSHISEHSYKAKSERNEILHALITMNIYGLKS